jgi:hypothetical protein
LFFISGGFYNIKHKYIACRMNWRVEGDPKSSKSGGSSFTPEHSASNNSSSNWDINLEPLAIRTFLATVTWKS